MDGRRPVIVGVGQITQRRPDAATSGGVIDLMADALTAAADDCGVPSVLAELALVGAIASMSTQYVDAARLVAQRTGATHATTLRCSIGGNTPLQLLGLLASEIQAGQLDVAAIVGAEAFATKRAARKAGVVREWPANDLDAQPDRLMGSDEMGSSAMEVSNGLLLPSVIYPLLENALRAHTGRTVAEHQRVIAELWSRFSAIGATNPHAWTPERKSVDFLLATGPDNRPTAFPYSKWLNANMGVDQGAALIVCSVDAARRMGVPTDKWVFPRAVANANDHWYVSTRPALHVSPAIAAAGRLAGQLGGSAVDDAALIDLYSCFPIAVELGADALGLSLDDPRGLTVTGGLTFGGGPGNSYVTNSLASLVTKLREVPAGSLALATGLGWYATKHSVGYLANDPGPGPFASGSAQHDVERASQPRSEDADYLGPATVVSNTVVYDRDGQPAQTIVLVDTPDGARSVATSPSSEFAGLATTDEFIGSKVEVAVGTNGREVIAG